MEELRNALRSALVSRFGVKKSLLKDETALFSAGLLDSLTVMELVGFVESQIDGEISPTDITLDNFDSIEQIVRFVARMKPKDSAQ
jgi:acyl carrier protein